MIVNVTDVIQDVFVVRGNVFFLINQNNHFIIRLVVASVITEGLIPVSDEILLQIFGCY